MTSDTDKTEKELIGLNIHSVYTLCNECHTWGVNIPLNHECGNCGSKDTTIYYDIETVTSFLLKAIDEARKEERKKLFTTVKGCLPEKKDLPRYFCEERDKGLKDGYNRCIDIITNNLKEKGIL